MTIKSNLLCVAMTLASLYGCAIVEQGNLTVRGGEEFIYECGNGDRIVARYYSLSDASLDFVKLFMPDGKEYTLPRAMSGSGARYTDDVDLVWWIKGDSALVEKRAQDGQWQVGYPNCRRIGREK
ncbi:MAG: MliC family protein [Pseudomonadota bacterium]